MLLPDIATVLVCDDVRKEVTGKDILIGVYVGDILVPAFPASLRLAAWLELVPKEVGQVALDIRAGFPDQNAQLQLRLQINDLVPLGVALPGLQLVAQEQTEFVLEIRDGKDWRVLKRKRVRQGQTILPAPGTPQSPFAAA
jgi:hypothetical protein